MKPAFVKKHTEGGAAGLDWEAGEVKAINPYLADELVRLSHGDYEIVQEGEFTPPAPVHNHQGTEFLQIKSDGNGINIHRQEASVVEVEVEESTAENAAVAEKLTEVTEKAVKKVGRQKKKPEIDSTE